jgi:hypothetical protein
MVEFNFLTIIISLAVCSLLVYAVFQYTKVRLSVLEQSHKEQAMILQQYIEESSTDIHRLYQMTTSDRSDSHPQNGGSIILEYANENNSEKHVSSYNQPHTIHLDTAAFFQNKRSSNLIEISSDSEDTTESESDTTDESDTDTGSETDTDTDTGSESGSDTESDAHGDADVDNNEKDDTQNLEKEENIVPESVVSIEIENHTPSTETKMVTVDLGTIQEPDINSSTENHVDVISILYKKAQETPLPDDAVDVVETITAPQFTVPAVITLSGMSVTELKALLKEKYKNQPEKYAEIQKLKKAELINALQQIQ